MNIYLWPLFRFLKPTLYQHETYGYNYRLSNVAAAIGVGQLQVLDERVARRREIGTRYRKAFGELSNISFMPEPDWSYSTRWLTPITINPIIIGVNREVVREALLQCEIESRPLWKPMICNRSSLVAHI